MKTNFTKKIIKISTVVILTFFLLFIYVRAQEDNNPFTNAGLTTGSIIYYDEESETYPCSESSTVECIMTTRKYKKDKNIDGFEITQVIQKPNDGISGEKYRSIIRTVMVKNGIKLERLTATTTLLLLANGKKAKK